MPRGIYLHRIKHGHAPDGHVSPEYNSWVGMIQRCTNPHSISWHKYGGRGIKVCERWMVFANFLADMGLRPEPKKCYSIERINNDGNYEPGNCKWATKSEQAKNQRKRKFTPWPEWRKKRGLSEEHRKHMSEAHRRRRSNG